MGQIHKTHLARNLTGVYYEIHGESWGRTLNGSPEGFRGWGIPHSQAWSPDVIQRISTLVPLMVVTLLGNGRHVAWQRGNHRGADVQPATQRQQPCQHIHHQPGHRRPDSSYLYHDNRGKSLCEMLIIITDIY